MCNVCTCLSQVVYLDPNHEKHREYSEVVGRFLYCCAGSRSQGEETSFVLISALCVFAPNVIPHPRRVGCHGRDPARS